MGIENRHSGYTDGEAAALVAPLLGWDPGDVEHFVVIGIGPKGTATAGDGDLAPEQATVVMIGSAAAMIAGAFGVELRIGENGGGAGGGL